MEECLSYTQKVKVRVLYCPVFLVYKMFLEYKFIIYALCIVSCLGIGIYLLSYFLIFKNLDIEKISMYECGFNPFDDSHKTFEVKFYLVALLFVVFDLEIAFLFPWLLILGNLNFYGFFIIFVFLGILGLIFVYEWFIGALDW